MWVSPARSVLSLGFGVVLGACTGPYASTTDSTETELPCPIGSEGCACTAGGSCDAPLVCASNVCVSADATTGGAVTTSGSTSMDTANATVAGNCSPAADGPSPDCSGETPYCGTKGECVGCSDIASCTAVNPLTPACDAASGECVECSSDDASACVDQRPVCDTALHTCRGCTDHGECPGSACDLESGACFPADQALHVGGAGCNDNGDGAEGAPLCTIKAALGLVAKGSKSVPRAVLIQSGTYSDALVVPGGFTVALIGTAAPRLTGKGAEALRVDAGAHLFADGLEIRGNTDGAGLGCTNASVWLDNSVVAEHMSGVNGTNCTIRLRGGVVAKNSSEGIYATSGQLHLENAFVSENGGISGRGGLALAGGAAAEVVYTTLYGNAASIGLGHSVDCDPDGPSESVTVRNAILLNLKGYATNSCDKQAEIVHSAISAMADGPMGGDNLGVTDETKPALIAADPKLLGVFRPIKDSALSVVGLWTDPDPRVDFEGDARQMDIGFPGADQP